MLLLEKSVVIIHLINRLNRKNLITIDAPKVLDLIYTADENSNKQKDYLN